MKLYIIHGWTYTVEPWHNTIQLLEENGIKVEMLHVPGLTTSSKKVYTIDDYQKWANQSIPDGAIALGHSNGGRILLNLLSEKPDKLRHLILLDAAGVYEESKKRDLSRKVSKTLSPLKKIKPLRKVAHRLLGASDYDRAPENMKATLSNMLDSDKNLDISRVTTPTTIIWGEADTTTPPHQGRIIHQLIPGSELIMRRRWTHAPYISHPTELANLLTSVMNKIAAPASSGGSSTHGTASHGGVSTPDTTPHRHRNVAKSSLASSTLKSSSMGSTPKPSPVKTTPKSSKNTTNSQSSFYPTSPRSTPPAAKPQQTPSRPSRQRFTPTPSSHPTKSSEARS